MRTRTVRLSTANCSEPYFSLFHKNAPVAPQTAWFGGTTGVFFTPYAAAVLLMGLSTLQTGWRCEVEEKML